MLWLQPLAMILGIVMLATIAFVTLSTGKSPFHQINRHLSPVLGWGWLIATVMANCLWTMPQFDLAWKSLNQALVPGLPDQGVGKAVVVGVLALICVGIVLLYDAPGKGVKLFELILKIMVGLIVLSFVGAVVMLTVHGQLDWGQLAGGFIPDPRMLASPAPGVRRRACCDHTRVARVLGRCHRREPAEQGDRGGGGGGGCEHDVSPAVFDVAQGLGPDVSRARAV